MIDARESPLAMATLVGGDERVTSDLPGRIGDTFLGQLWFHYETMGDIFSSGRVAKKMRVKGR